MRCRLSSNLIAFFNHRNLLPSGFPYHKLVILGLKLKLCLSSSSDLVEHFESFRNEPYGERLRGRVIFVMRLKGVVASKKNGKHSTQMIERGD